MEHEIHVHQQLELLKEIIMYVLFSLLGWKVISQNNKTNCKYKYNRLLTYKS